VSNPEPTSQELEDERRNMESRPFVGTKKESSMAEPAVEQQISADDWEAAMAEQQPASAAQPPAQAAQIFPQFAAGAVGGNTEAHNDLDLILDIPVSLAVELGRTKISIKSLLQLAHGSVVELDALAGEPMDVLVNGTLIAQGEVVVVNDKFGIRLTDIITPSERIRKLNR
jgi:flagellar motor switch protein FliN/FliY